MPQAVTRSSTPSCGQVASGTVPIDISPGPSQIAARMTLPSHAVPIEQYHTELSYNLGDAGDRIHLHADPRRRHARRTPGRYTPRSRPAASATSGARTWGFPQAELQAFMDDIRSNGHTSYLEVVSESEEATLESARVAAEVNPDYLIGGTLIEPVQEIIAGTGDQVLPVRRPDRRAPVPAAGQHRRDRRGRDAGQRHGASTASTCWPTATTATSTRWSRPSSRRRRCR